LLFSLVAALPAKAATIVWNNTAGGDWNTAANWSPATAPGSDDAAVISSSGAYTITISADTTVGAVTMNASSGAQTLDLLGGAFVVTGEFDGNAQSALILDGGAATNWNGGASDTVGALTINSGTIEGTTPVTVLNPGGFIWNGGASFGVSYVQDVLYVNGGLANNPSYLDGGQLINTGLLNWVPYPYVENGAIISNAASGTISIILSNNTGGVNFDVDQGGMNGLYNAGTIIISGEDGDVVGTSDQFTNTGTLTVNTATWVFGNAGLCDLTNGVVDFGISDVSSNYGKMVFDGTGDLAGTLNVHFYGGFLPSVGQSWQLITAGGDIPGLSGNFASTILPPIAVWQVSQNLTALTVTVLKLVPQIAWQQPASIVYGTMLSGEQLNAGASWASTNVPGTLTYNPPLNSLLPAGNQTLSVTFTPSDPATFTNVTVTTEITVQQAPLTITANSTNKIFGQATTFAGTEFTVAGLKNSETIGTVTLTSAGAAAVAPAGDYSIVPSAPAGGTFSQGNYADTFVSGSLTVTGQPDLSLLTVGTQNILTFSSVTNELYQVQFSTNLASTNWQALSGWMSGTGNGLSVNVALPSESTFYRLEITF
jgi:hypothetical protein